MYVCTSTNTFARVRRHLSLRLSCSNVTWMLNGPESPSYKRGGLISTSHIGALSSNTSSAILHRGQTGGYS